MKRPRATQAERTRAFARAGAAADLDALVHGLMPDDALFQAELAKREAVKTSAAWRRDKKEAALTTKVIVVCPDNSVHDVLVQVVKDEVVVDTMLVPPHGQSEPVYLDGKTRLLVSEVDRKAEPKAS